MANNFMSYDNAEEVFGGFAQDLKDRTDHITVTYEQWMQMTDEEKENGRYYVTGVPSVDGTVQVDTMVKLWENEDITQAFAAQTVELGTSDYDLLLITFIQRAVGYPKNDSVIVAKGTEGILSTSAAGGNGVVSRIRLFNFSNSNTSLDFDDGGSASGSTAMTTDNTSAIPTAIYGIKTSQTIEIKAIARDISTSADKCMLTDGVTSVEDEFGTVTDSIDDNTDAIEALVNVYGSKNLNSYPYNETTVTKGTLVFTDNGDGSITVSGTNNSGTGYNAFSLHSYYTTNNSCKLKPGRYTLTGCPAGGSGSTYYLRIWVNDTVNMYDEIGNGVTFEVTTESLIHFEIQIVRGSTITLPLTFKPMIRDARIKDDTWVPYAMTNAELTQSLTFKTYTGLTPESGYTLSSNYSRKSSNFLYLSGAIVGTMPLGSWTKIATIDVSTAFAVSTCVIRDVAGALGKIDVSGGIIRAYLPSDATGNTGVFIPPILMFI